MPPRQRRPVCFVCHHRDSKYTCASCRVNYCSVACYKQHKETCSPGSVGTTPASLAASPCAPPEPPRDAGSNPNPDAKPEPVSQPDITVHDRPPTERPLPDPPRLRPLTALNWPYVPDTSAYPDPLTRNDPKLLQLHQYEAIATSSAIRTILRSNPHLCDLLTSIDAFRGPEREEALQRALGVDSRLLKNNADADGAHQQQHQLDEDTRALRALAEAVEGAVRGGREDVLGLDWD